MIGILLLFTVLLIGLPLVFITFWFCWSSIEIVENTIDRNKRIKEIEREIHNKR
jgi:hypothetical protein